MTYKLRDYQQAASDAAIRFFGKKTGPNGLLVLPTAAGKSVICADIISRLDDHVLVFGPNKEIIEQDYEKLCNMGVLDCSLYSASCGRKDISRVTFATIGSVRNHAELFDHFRYVIVDEAHTVNPEQGTMYRDFIVRVKHRRVLGMTATPYRLHSSCHRGIIKMITATRPRVFGEIIYDCPIRLLLERGYLAKLQYYDMERLDTRKIKLNSTGRDFDEESYKQACIEQEFGNSIRDMVIRLLHPKSGIPRNGILVFTQYVEECKQLCNDVEGVVMVTAETTKSERERIVSGFKEGRIKVLANVGCLTTGFDYPGLDTTLLARPTMSMGLYTQMVGRAFRPYADKVSWIVDICGNLHRFGRVEDMRIIENPMTKNLEVYGNIVTKSGTVVVKQLTNVLM